MFPRLGLGGVLTFEEKPAVRGMKRARDEFGRFVKTTDQVPTKMGRVSGAFSSFGGVLKTAGVAAGVAMIVVGFKKLVRSAAELETGMARISTLLDPVSGQMQGMTKDVLRMSDKFGLATKDMTDGLFQAISAGVKETESLGFMAVASKAAIGGFTNVKTAVEGLTTVMNVWGLKTAPEALRAADSINIANKLGKTTFEEVSRSIGRAAASAKGAGLSYDELLSTVVAVTKGGVVTSETMSGLKAALAGLAHPTKATQEEAARLGIQFNTAAIQSKGWAKFLGELTEKTKGDKVVIDKLFGSIEAGNTILNLVSQDGFANFSEAMEGMRNGAGATEEAFEKAAATATHQWNRMTTSLANLSKQLGLRLFDSFGGTFDGLADSISNFRQGLDEVMDIDWSNAEQAQRRVTELSRKYGKDTIKTAMWVSWGIDIISAAWTALKTTIGVIFATLDATVGEFFRGFMEFFAPIRIAIQRVVEVVGKLFNTLFGWLTDETGSTVGGMKSVFSTFGKFVGFILMSLIEGLAKLLSWLNDAIETSRSAMEEGLSYIHEAGAGALETLGIISEETEKRQKRMARGALRMIREERRARSRQLAEDKKRLKKLGELSAEASVAPTREAARGTEATRKAATAAATARGKPPCFDISVTSKLNLDGKEVNSSVSRAQREVHARAGFKATPWQRRMMLEQGAMPATATGR